jgi:hypothetical protein
MNDESSLLCRAQFLLMRHAESTANELNRKLIDDNAHIL